MKKNSTVKQLTQARAISMEIFGTQSTALTALDIYDRLDEDTDDEDIAVLFSNLSATHKASVELFGDTVKPDVTLELFSMICDDDVDENELFANLVGVQGQVREAFGEEESRDPDVVMAVYDREFGVVDEDEDE